MSCTFGSLYFFLFQEEFSRQRTGGIRASGYRKTGSSPLVEAVESKSQVQEPWQLGIVVARFVAAL